MILLKGLQGPVTVEGHPFNGAMPAWGTTLTDKKIAAILTYVRQAFGNTAGPIAPEQIADARKEFARAPDSWSRSRHQGGARRRGIARRRAARQRRPRRLEERNERGIPSCAGFKPMFLRSLRSCGASVRNSSSFSWKHPLPFIRTIRMTRTGTAATMNITSSGFWQKYVFSTDHKMIGIQYGITGLCFLFFGFCLMMVMRWQLAISRPGAAGIRRHSWRGSSRTTG